MRINSLVLFELAKSIRYLFDDNDPGMSLAAIAVTQNGMALGAGPILSRQALALCRGVEG